MNKTIMIFDKGKYLGNMDIEENEHGSLLAMFTGKGLDDKPIYALYVTDLDYGIVISKETYEQMNTALDVLNEEGED